MNKLALLGIASGFLLTLPGEAICSSTGTHDVMGAISWTCRSGGCGYKGHQPAAAVTEADYQADEYVPTDSNQFYKQLDVESRQLYDGLDDQGRQLAIRLSRQYVNKGQAVKEAANVMKAQNTETHN